MQRAPHNNIIATPDYNEWKYLRKMTNPGFSPDNIRKVSKCELSSIVQHRTHRPHPVGLPKSDGSLDKKQLPAQFSFTLLASSTSSDDCPMLHTRLQY